MAYFHSPRVVTDGLVLALDAANTKSYPGSGTTWRDLSGNGNNGTLTNGPTFNSDNGGSIVFDGVDDYVSVNMGNFFTSYTQQITIETWVYIPTSATWANQFLGNIITRGNYIGSYGLWRTTVNNEVSARFRGDAAVVESKGFITRDVWYQLAAIWTGNQAQLYINGNLTSSSEGSLQNPTNTVAFEIGRNTAAGGSNGNYFNGKQTGIKIYNRALTASEVLQNYNATKGRYGL